MSLSLLFFLSTVSSLQAAFVVPIQKDHTYRQYVTTIFLKTPLQPTKLFLDLGATITWVNCADYISSTYQHVPCGTPFCNSFDSRACGICGNSPTNATCSTDELVCSYFPENSVTHEASVDPLLIDSLALTTTHGSKQGSLTTLSNYSFSCGRTSLLKGLAESVVGMAAFGRSNISLQAQVSSSYSAPACFALCLSGSRNGLGVGFLGSKGPYILSPGIDISNSLAYTPLLINPVGGTVIPYNYPSNEYFIGLTSIKVNNNVIPINRTLLVIDNESGYGGTKVSTSVTYTTLEASIYKAFTAAFLKESSSIMNLTAAKSVSPFKFCYPVEGVPTTSVGPAFPTIDLALGGNVNWRIFGANSMVKAIDKGKYFWCLGFMDGGVNPRTPIVIGGYQMEDNLLQFDLQSNRLGLSSSLLLKGTSCANFNFTSGKQIP